MNLSPVNVTKKITTTIVGIGAGKIVSAIVQNNTDPEKTTDKVAITLGAYALGGMVADAASAYTDAKIDEIVKSIDDIKAAFNKSKSTDEK